jgi:hypothetical protein
MDPVVLEASAPEVAEAIRTSDTEIEDGFFDDERESNSAIKPGHGRFLGIMLSWTAPRARVLDSDSYADVIVTTDGRVGHALYTDVPVGMWASSRSATTASSQMRRFQAAAMRMAAEFVQPAFAGGPLASERPFVSGYVIQYPWGVVILTPDLSLGDPAMIGYGNAALESVRTMRVLSRAERARLDSLTATDVAKTYLESGDAAVQYWLKGPTAVDLDSSGSWASPAFVRRSKRLAPWSPGVATPNERLFRVDDLGKPLGVWRTGPSAPWKVRGFGV